MQNWPIVAASWMLALIFATALHHKLTGVRRFNASLSAYRLVPEAGISIAGWAIVALESIAVCLLLLATSMGLVLAAILLSAYATAIAINVIRGRTHIDCGCGDEPTPVSWAVVLRNVILVSIALLAMNMPFTAMPSSLAGILFCAAAAGIGYGIYRCAEELLANRGRHQRLWLGVTS